MIIIFLSKADEEALEYWFESLDWKCLIYGLILGLFLSLLIYGPVIYFASK